MLARVAMMRVKVKIGVVGQVDRAGPIDLGLIADRQVVVVVQLIAYLRQQFARKALIAVRRVKVVNNAVFALADDLPAALVEAPASPAVQLVLTLIRRQLDSLLHQRRRVAVVLAPR